MAPVHEILIFQNNHDNLIFFRPTNTGSSSLVVPKQNKAYAFFSGFADQKTLIQRLFQRPKTTSPTLNNSCILSLLCLFISINIFLHLLLSSIIRASRAGKSACFTIMAQLLHRSTTLKTSVCAGPHLA